MMLLPRDDDDQKVLDSEIEITPAPLQFAWSQDDFGNHVATAQFDDRAAELRLSAISASTMRRRALTMQMSTNPRAVIRSPTRTNGPN